MVEPEQRDGRHTADRPTSGVSVSELLRKYTPEFVRKHPDQAIPHVKSTLAKLELCRTEELGTHYYYCSKCSIGMTVYNSCGASQCPCCAGGKRSAWLDSTAKLLLESVTYFQVVFTIPDKLSSLALGNRKEMFNLLFRSAWQSLKQVVSEEQGFEPAAAMVLHTWNQKLDAHVHVHALVPGGGPALSGQPRWITSCRRHGARLPGAYLADADTLRVRFRETFLAGLLKLHSSGKLKLNGEWSELQDEVAFEEYLEPLKAVDWVTYIQPPPVIKTSNNTESTASPDQVLKYLARYMTGGPISARRIVAHKKGQVTFLARQGAKTGGSSEQVPITLSGVEFVRRWCLHIQPHGFVKARRFGGYSNRHSRRYLAECRSLLPTIEASPTPAQPESTTADSASDSPEDRLAPTCPSCGEKMQLFYREFRPSWGITMSGPHRPWWYDDG